MTLYLKFLLFLWFLIALWESFVETVRGAFRRKEA